jgi:tyrosinase
VPLRREIRDLQAHFPDQWTLYILGLDALQKATENDLLSYYQIAGIHGLPYKPWNGVAGIANFNPQHGGYCTHSSILFAPWHRPYLALFEQSLYGVVQVVATKFPQALKARFAAAAKDFRIPYWDWASSASPAFPTFLTTEQIKIMGTDGTIKPILNPLFSFKFHPVNPARGDFDSYWSQFDETVRYPDREGQSQNSQVTRALRNESDSLRTNVSIILLSQTYGQFDAFSNNAWLQNGHPGQYSSLEDLHNEIHDKTGGNGHMSSLDVAGFDPIFMLHHCNVDRLWAMWQALNPTSYVTERINQDGNFTTPSNGKEDIHSPLKPFWDNSGTTFWQSGGVKDTPRFGYAYPETQSWSFTNLQTYQANLRANITQQYGSNALSGFARSFTGLASHALPASLLANKAVVQPKTASPAIKAVSVAMSEVKLTEAGDDKASASAPASAPAAAAVKTDSVGSKAPEAPAAPAPTPAVPVVIKTMLKDKKYTEWITNIRAIKHGLNQTFRVFVFVGDFNQDPATWAFEPNLAGRFTVLSRSGNATTATATCAKCVEDAAAALVVTGTVPLTSALLTDIAAGRLLSLRSEDVEPYLVKNLHWRITLFDGTERPRDQVPGLKVSVCSTEVTIGADDVPVYDGVYTLHNEITDGRPAGLGGDDEV